MTRLQCAGDGEVADRNVGGCRTGVRAFGGGAGYALKPSGACFAESLLKMMHSAARQTMSAGGSTF